MNADKADEQPDVTDDDQPPAQPQATRWLTSRNIIGAVLLVGIVSSIMFVVYARKTRLSVDCGKLRQSELEESQQHLLAHLDTEITRLRSNLTIAEGELAEASDRLRNARNAIAATTSTTESSTPPPSAPDALAAVEVDVTALAADVERQRGVVQAMYDRIAQVEGARFGAASVDTEELPPRPPTWAVEAQQYVLAVAVEEAELAARDAERAREETASAVDADELRRAEAAAQRAATAALRAEGYAVAAASTSPLHVDHGSGGQPGDQGSAATPSNDDGRDDLSENFTRAAQAKDDARLHADQAILLVRRLAAESEPPQQVDVAPNPGHVPKPWSMPRSDIALTPDTAIAKIHLGSSRNGKRVEVRLSPQSDSPQPSTEEAAAPLPDVFWFFASTDQLRRDSGLQIPREEVQTWARRVGDAVYLTVCVDPKSSLDAGRYTGSAMIADSSMRQFTIPVEVTAQTVLFNWTLIVLLVGPLFALVFVWAKLRHTADADATIVMDRDERKDFADEHPERRAPIFDQPFRNWMKTNFILAFAVGIGAIWAALQVPLRNETFGDSFLGSIGTIVVSGVAAVGAITPVVGKVKGEGIDWPKSSTRSRTSDDGGTADPSEDRDDPSG